MKKYLTVLFLIMFVQLSFAGNNQQNRVNDVKTIAQARVDLNSDKIPDNLGDTLTITGVVFTPNFQTKNRSYYIWDGTAGIDLYKVGLTSPELNIGDSVIVTGKIDQYNGLTEIAPLTDTSVVILKNNAVLPSPIVVSITDFKNNGELYEGSLIQINGVSKLSGTWPVAAKNATIKITTTGTDTLDLYVDLDTDIDGSVEPVWPKDVIGVASQFSSTSLGSGYQIIPRSTADFLTQVPVELGTFTASTKNNSVVLNWQTITELNNKGFEVYRNNHLIKFVPGFGTTSEKKSYQLVDQSLSSGTYSYKLVQVDLNGSKKEVAATEAKISSTPSQFSLAQNYPNPFNPSTSIKFSLPSDAKVSLKVYNILGVEVANLVDGNLSAGLHQVKFDASLYNSGIYFYKISVKTIDGNMFTNTMKMMLVK